MVNRITALLDCYADYITQASEDVDLENEPKAIKNQIEKESLRDRELFLQSNINFILSKLKDINEFIEFNDSVRRPIYSEQKDGILNILEYLSYLTVKTSFECLPEYKNLFENLEHYNDKLVNSIKSLLKVGMAFNLQYFILECQKRLFERAYDSFDQLIRMPLPESFVEKNQRYIDLLGKIGHMATHEKIFSNKSKTITGIILKILPQLDTSHLIS
ncbi:MAG: hypothetical protein AB7F64_06380 [Gammaproteobacteria bacterium]